MNCLNTIEVNINIISKQLDSTKINLRADEKMACHTCGFKIIFKVGLRLFFRCL